MKKLNLLILGIIGLFFLGCSSSKPQTAAELLDKSIAYHDPEGKWETLEATINLVQIIPKKPNRETTVFWNNGQKEFSFAQTIGKDTIITRSMKGEQCTVEGKPNATILDTSKYNLTCDYTAKYKDYYTYLYGLPMKLKDPGTILDPEIKVIEFNGKPCQSIRVTYEETVGKDIWYFYFEPETYAMVGYRFYKDEAKNDGEYITLEEEANVNGIKMPKVRTWYYNSNDELLGTDKIK